MQDYARQTVTMEPHPHLSSHHASVHPCKVAAAAFELVMLLVVCFPSPVVDNGSMRNKPGRCGRRLILLRRILMGSALTAVPAPVPRCAIILYVA